MENNVVSVMLWGEEVGKLYWVFPEVTGLICLVP